MFRGSFCNVGVPFLGSFFHRVMGKCGSDHPHILKRRGCKCGPAAMPRTDEKNYDLARSVATEPRKSSV